MRSSGLFNIGTVRCPLKIDHHSKDLAIGEKSKFRFVMKVDNGLSQNYIEIGLRQPFRSGANKRKG